MSDLNENEESSLMQIVQSVTHGRVLEFSASFREGSENGDDWTVTVRTHHPDFGADGRAKTFARALRLALEAADRRVNRGEAGGSHPRHAVIARHIIDNLPIFPS